MALAEPPLLPHVPGLGDGGVLGELLVGQSPPPTAPPEVRVEGLGFRV